MSISADTTSRRNWGAALGELAGIGLSLSEREIARRYLPTLIGANPAEDSALVLAEIDRLTALPGSNSRGWNERFVLSQVSDAYARAREDIKTAWPIFCEMIVAGFQVVQSQRTDVANVTPVSAVEQTRNFYAQSAQVLHLLPSTQTILSCLSQHFDRCHAFLSGAATTWQQEVDAASMAGNITRNPNPGLRGTETPQQRAYDAAVSALGDAERLYRQAVSTGVARYISAATVTLEKARVTLQQAEAALKGTNTATTPAQLTKEILENGDIVTIMNKTSLQYILAGLPAKIASVQGRLGVVTSATVRVSLQTELTHWQTLRTAAQGLLALIPAGQTVPTISTASAREWVKYIEKTTTDPVPTHNWGRVENGARLEGEAGLWTIFAEGGLAKANFEITEEKMVNIWVDNHTGADLRLLNAQGVEVWAPRIRNGSDAESFSGVLAPGVYRIEVTSETFEQTLPVRRSQLIAGLHVEVVPRSRNQIIGRVSREGSSEVMPVRMSVAEFFNNGVRNSNYVSAVTDGGVNNLDPGKPVWVVIHGMYNNDGQAYPDADFDDTMHLLTKSMADFGRLSDTQVVTIDWHEAARDNHLLLGQLQDATWTERVGAWVGSQLLNLGFPPSKINIAGFSHGTYVSYFAAKKIQEAGLGSVQSLIALDPATNVGFLNGNGTIDASSIRFSEVANTSVALKASITQEVTFSSNPLSIPAQIAALSLYHAIEFGSDARALTAHHSFNLLVGGQTDKSRVHNFPVTAFSRMVQDIVAGHPNDLAQSVLNPFNLLTRIDGAGAVTKSSYDGVVRAVGSLDHRQSGEVWAHALPVDILLRDGTLLDLEDHLYEPLP